MTDCPTLAGFVLFIRNQMGIDASILPDASPTIPFAYKVSKAIVNCDLAIVPPIYELAVYNLGGSNIVNFAQDLPDAPTVDGSDPPLPFFEYMRTKWNIGSFVAGVVSASSDVSTSQTLVVQKAAEDFTLADLTYLKDPWGRQYLAFAQRYGSLVGLT